MATPPPNISGRPVLLNQVTPVYYPKAMLPNQAKYSYDWTTPVGSAQTSPALSIISVTDKEVEAVMAMSSSNQTSDLTPSPSPLVGSANNQGARLDDIDMFIADAFSFGDSTEPKVELPSTSVKDVPNTSSSQLFSSVAKIQKSLKVTRTASEPSRKQPAKTPLRGSRSTTNPSTPQPAANQSQVALQFNEQEGTAVITIVPPSPKSAKTETFVAGVSPLCKKTPARRLTSSIGMKRSLAATKSPRLSVGQLPQIKSMIQQFEQRYLAQLTF